MYGVRFYRIYGECINNVGSIESNKARIIKARIIYDKNISQWRDKRSAKWIKYL